MSKAGGRDAVPGFGAAVRKERERQGMTLEDLAALCGSGFSALSKVERGGRAPSLRLALAIADALGVPVTDLVPPPPRPRKRKESP